MVFCRFEDQLRVPASVYFCTSIHTEGHGFLSSSRSSALALFGRCYRVIAQKEEEKIVTSRPEEEFKRPSAKRVWRSFKMGCRPVKAVEESPW